MEIANEDDEFQWTTGNNSTLVHLQLIGHGGAGEVHEVRRLPWNFR